MILEWYKGKTDIDVKNEAAADGCFHTKLATNW